MSACALLLAACGGGGSGDSSPAQPVATTPQPQPVPTPTSVPAPAQPDPAPVSTPSPSPPFTLLSTVPADGATAVPRNATFNATFSDTVAPVSVTPASARFVGPEGNVIPADVSVNSTGISLVPSFGLPGNTTYRIELAGSISAADGSTLGTTFSKQFTTAAQSWQTSPTTIGQLQDLRGGTSPIIKADPRGNVTAVWLNSPSLFTTTIMASRRDVRTGTWSAPVNLAASNITDAVGTLFMTVSATGDVYVAWSEYGSNVVVRKIQHFDAVGGTWNALPAMPTPDFSGTFSFVTDAAGKLTAIVHRNGVYAVGFDAASGTWAAPVRIDSPDAPAISLHDLAAVADGKGGLIAAWLEDVPGGRGLYVTRYGNGSWSIPQRLDDNVLTDTYPAISLAANPNGSGAISWAHNNGMGGIPAVMASALTGGSARWSTPVRLDQQNPVLGAINPRTVVDAAGVATTIWTQNEGLFASRFDLEKGTWSSPQRIHDNPGKAVAVADMAGNVMVVQESNASFQAAQYLVADGKWHDSAFGQPAAGKSGIFVNPPTVTIDAGGSVTVAWFAWNTVNGVSEYPVSVSQFR